MKIKKISALIMAVILCFAVICPSVLASDELQLTVLDANAENGNDVASNLVDGNNKTSWGMNWWNGTTTACAVIKASRQVTAKGYVITTGEDAKSYRNRNPRDWKLYGCNDYDEATKTGGEWILLHSVKNDSVLQNVNSQSYNYYMDNDLSYSYYRLEITANKGNNYLKICEFSLLETVDFDGFIDGKQGVNDSENYTNLFDGNVNTKYCVETGSLYVVARIPQETVVTGYTFTTGNDTAGEPGRNPKSWVLYGSNDYNEDSKEGTWNAVHSVTNDTTMQAKNYEPYKFIVDNNTTPYKYYKFEFNEVQSGDLMQLSEIKFEHTPVVHNWTMGEKVESTCTKTGSIKQTCADCGKERTLEIAVAAHTWTETGRDAPACTKTGTSHQKCAVCGALKNVEIPATGHNWAEESRDEPSCTEAGYSHQKCAACGALQDVEIPATGHTWAEDSRDEPTCYDSGVLIEHCEACGLKRETELPLLGHSQGEDGKCKNCHEYIIRVRDRYYCDLQKAIGEALHTDEVVMLQNIAIRDTLNIINDRILNLNGHTIKKVGEGRAIKVGTNKFTLRDSAGGGRIIGGTASGIGIDTYGGGVYIEEYRTFNMEGGTISGCSAANEGGGIYVSLNSTLKMSGGAAIENCTADGYGGGIMNYGTVNISGGSIKNCSAKWGGGIYASGIYGGGKLNLSDCTIGECTASEYGGGIYAMKNAALTIAGSRIEDNSAAIGGGIRLAGGTLSLSNSAAERNTAGDGGGIYVSSSTTTLKDSSVSYNTSTGNGGSIYQLGGTLTMDGGSVDFNDASGNGGGIYAAKGDDESILTLNSGSVRDNTAAIGAGVYVDRNVTLNLNSANVSVNTAKTVAGGIYAGGTINVGKTPQVSGSVIAPDEGTDGTDSNLYLPAGKTMTITEDGIYGYEGDTGFITPAICVTSADGAASITGDCEDFSEYFKADSTDYAVSYEDGVIKLLNGCKVTFEYVYGDEIYPQIETVVSGQAVGEPDGEPYKNGYAFVGWLLDGKDYDFSKPVTGDITITPKWVKTGKTSLSVNFGKLYVIDLEQNAKVYVAAYDENGALIDACIDTIEDSYFPTLRTKSFDEMGIDVSAADSVTAFLWDENMHPLCDAAAITLK